MLIAYILNVDKKPVEICQEKTVLYCIAFSWYGAERINN